jgi:hypothetical protein
MRTLENSFAVGSLCLTRLGEKRNICEKGRREILDAPLRKACAGVHNDYINPHAGAYGLVIWEVCFRNDNICGRVGDPARRCPAIPARRLQPIPGMTASVKLARDRQSETVSSRKILSNPVRRGCHQQVRSRMQAAQ